MTEKIVKSETEWKRELTPNEYRVTREAGTEPAFSGKYWKTKDPGTYHCVCCGAPLFDSATKFDSGTGWPSFYAPADEKTSWRTRIPATAWFGPRHAAQAATRI